MFTLSRFLPACLSADTPPGYFTSGGSTSKCAAGSYRASWATGSEASSCQSCGTGVFAASDTQIEEYSITNPNSKTLVGVTTSASSCCEFVMQQQRLGGLQNTLLLLRYLLHALNCIQRCSRYLAV